VNLPAYETAASRADTEGASETTLCCSEFQDSIDLDAPIPELDFPPKLHLIKIPAGEDYLVGRLFAPQGNGPHPVIVLLHGFPGNQLNYDLAANFQNLGFHVFIFHYRGAWGSKGEFSIVHAQEDVETVLAYLRLPEVGEQFGIDSGRIGLVGHSFGGFLALMAAAKDMEIATCVSLSGVNFGLLVKKLSDQPEWRSQFEAFFEYPQVF